RNAKDNSIPTILHPAEEDLDVVLEEIPNVVKLDYQAPRVEMPRESLRDRVGSFMSRAETLHRKGTEWVIASLAREKVIFSSPKGAWIAEVQSSEMLYIYAAEDALLAGMIAAMAEHASPEEVVRLAMACNWECATHPEKFPGGRACVEELCQRVLLSKID
ncbi:MAG: PfkB family carbohydrate kinase, partial [Synergistaceae bacterium]|nr:PfkB family carbohydrate kinase [Synergistaceae bacterium]